MQIVSGQKTFCPRPQAHGLPKLANTDREEKRGSWSSSDKVSISSSLLAAGGSAAVSLTDVSKVDKLQHMGVTAAATVALGSLGFSPATSATLAWVGGTVGKEVVYDLVLGRGTPSVHDAIANLAGAFAGYATLKVAEGVGDQGS